MTRHDRRMAMKEALRKSFYDHKLTYVLITDDKIVITQDEQEAVRLHREEGYRVYAMCEDGRLVL